MVLIKTKLKAMEETIMNNDYLRGCSLEVAQQVSRCINNGHFQLLYIFNVEGNEKKHQVLIDYLRCKKYTVTEKEHRDGKQVILISWR